MTTPEKKIVTPTVGRKVWFRNNGSMQKLPRADGHTAHPELCGIEQPMDATVIFVHGTRMVNLDITDHTGQRFTATSVPLLQDGDDIPDIGIYCEWMPYQKGQAGKIEALEKGAAEVPATPQYRQPSQRDQLECALVSGAAAHLATVPRAADEIAAGIKKVLDVLHPDDLLQQRVPDSAIVALSDMKIPSIALSVIDPGPDSLEREIQAKANKGPQVTPAALQAEIVSASYFTAADGVRGSSEGKAGESLLPE